MESVRVRWVTKSQEYDSFIICCIVKIGFSHSKVARNLIVFHFAKTAVFLQMFPEGPQ